MGNRSSSHHAVSQREADINRAIEMQIKDDEKRARSEVKLLLLGSGESGKSTVLRQMRLIHSRGFDAEEREVFRGIVFSNVIEAMQCILEAMSALSIPFEDESLAIYIPLFERPIPTLNAGEPFPAEYLEPLKRLWADAGVQRACAQGHTFALHDNIGYFFSRLDQQWSNLYIPSDKDIVRCRAKTIGIVETVFHLGSLTYRMFDVGGQRSERRKWIHCFENVTAVLFTVAISGYDKCLIEDWNSMIDAMMLFENICNSHWFKNTSMILLLNKIDIFAKKIATAPINEHFKDYNGGADLELAKTYFKTRFEWLNRNPNKRVFTHFTDATDTDLLEHVMSAVLEIILNENIDKMLFYKRSDFTDETPPKWISVCHTNPLQNGKSEHAMIESLNVCA